MTNSHEWIDKIIAKLFEAEDRYSDNLIAELNRQNSEVKKQQFVGFMHMGQRFVLREYRPRFSAARRGHRGIHALPTLAFSLLEPASHFMKYQTRVDLDKSQIKQLLFGLLHQCNTLQEIRDTLPECLVPLVPEVAGLSRFIQDPCFLIRNDRFVMADYERIISKIEFYAMSHLIM